MNLRRWVADCAISVSTPTMNSGRELFYENVAQLDCEFGTPFYLYDEGKLRQSAADALAFPNAYGLKVRFAMKACPNVAILQLFDHLGLYFDASSGHEVHRLMHAGIPADHISLSTQELPKDFAELIEKGIHLNACSLNQLAAFGEAFPGKRVGLRFNPGLGSGGTQRTNVGGPGSSFGIWHELVPEVDQLVEKHHLIVERIHSHIGSGSDPEVWQRASGLTLDLVAHFKSVDTVNLGGGFKVGRVAGEQTTDLQKIGLPMKAQFENFAAEHGRELKLEIEPGTYLTGLAGTLVTGIQDVVSTGAEGNIFYKLDSGMTEILRPSMYGAQHQFTILTAEESGETQKALIVGHCCESGDILTPAPGEPEVLAPLTLPVAAPGDYCLIGGAGAYCSGMPAKNYNSFPESPEVLWRPDGEFTLIRKRQDLPQILANEVRVEF